MLWGLAISVLACSTNVLVSFHGPHYSTAVCGLVGGKVSPERGEDPAEPVTGMDRGRAGASTTDNVVHT